MTMYPIKYIFECMERIVNVRDYDNYPIDEKVVHDLINSFSMAPSLANTQPWELIIIEHPDEKERVIDASLDPFLSSGTYGAQGWIAQAPFVAVVCMEKRRALARLGEKWEVFAIGDIFAAVQNFRIAAALHSLATSVVREFEPDRLISNLGLPWYVVPLAIVTAGYSKAPLEVPPRFKQQDFVHWGRWG